MTISSYSIAKAILRNVKNVKFYEPYRIYSNKRPSPPPPPPAPNQTQISAHPHPTNLSDNEIEIEIE